MSVEATRAAFERRAAKALADAQLQRALEASPFRKAGGWARAQAELPDADALRERARAIKTEAVAHLDVYLEQLTNAIMAAGGVVHRAHDAQEACRIITDLARTRRVRLVVKAKSMISEEIELNRALQTDGVEVVETDLGEWIVQLAGERPSHIIAPAFHKTRQQVAELFSRHLGEVFSDDIPTLVKVARRELRQKFLAADMGISGVNFAVAETGTLMIVTNEGNGRLTTSWPRIHVALMSLEKVVPTWDDLTVLLKLLPRSATGQKISSYVTMFTGPRRSGELDGPEELHVVILDNGRSRLPSTEFAEALYCIRCGACLNVCPVYGKIGGHAYGAVYSGPIGLILTPLLQGSEWAASLAHASSLCGACREACPIHIDLPRLLVGLREKAQVERKIPWLERLAFRLASFVWNHARLYRFGVKVASILQQPFVREGRIAWAPQPLSRWTTSRDFPALAPQTFHARWKALARHGEPTTAPIPVSRPRSPVSSPARSETYDLVERFTTELQAVGGNVHQVKDEAEARRVVQMLVAARQRVAATPDLRDWIGAGVEVATVADAAGSFRDYLAQADLGLSSVDYAIAETGTLVIGASRTHPRTLGVLPPVHIAVLRREQIVPTLSDAVAHLRRSRPAMPSCLALHTGPSRTGDIEQTLTVGVHGPGELHVVLI